MKEKLCTICSCLLFASAAGAATWHVDIDHDAGANGTSWTNAFKYLQDALDEESLDSGDTIKVAGDIDGAIYHPDDATLGHTQGSRSETFTLVDGVEMYGGYAGYNAQYPDVCNPQLYKTILSGDLDDDDPADSFTNNEENSYHVVTATSASSVTILDGFIIQGGNADGTGSGNDGGGIRITTYPTISNCTFRWNRADGAGGGASAGGNGPDFIDCTFENNQAAYGGGVALTYGLSSFIDCTFKSNGAWRGGALHFPVAFRANGPKVVNCVFVGNYVNTDMPWAPGDPGGGALFSGQQAYMTNCLFVDNSSSDNGGAVHNETYNSDYINCTFYGNSADEDDDNDGQGGGFYSGGGGEPNITNCIFWANSDKDGTDESAQIHVANPEEGDPTVDYTCVQGLTGGLGGTGNIDDDPQFVDADGVNDILGDADDNLRLPSNSDCVDAGLNSAVPDDDYDVDEDGNTDEPTPDLDLGHRIIAAVVDMGPYEYGDPATMDDAEPNDDDTLWRSENNVVRLLFSNDVLKPETGELLIQKLLTGGNFGSDLSGFFTFTVEEDTPGNPRILKIHGESAATLDHRSWYAIRNTDGWTGVEDFEVHYVVQVGDANADKIVLVNDLSVINSGIPTDPAEDDDRKDIDGDGDVDWDDMTEANGSIPSVPVSKPSGH